MIPSKGDHSHALHSSKIEGVAQHPSWMAARFVNIFFPNFKARRQAWACKIQWRFQARCGASNCCAGISSQRGFTAAGCQHTLALCVG